MNKMVGLFKVDSKDFPNLALMKLSTYHKMQGDIVRWYSPLVHDFFDIIYASKIFTYTSEKDAYLRAPMIAGGPGFDLYTKLPEEIDHCCPDYSLYDLKYSLGYITKGCLRNCPWCIVPTMEGRVYKFAGLEEFTRHRHIRLLDNNILAYKENINELKKLVDSGKRFDFTQGFDIRLITPENAKILRELKRWHGLRYKFAFDLPHLKSIIDKKLKILFDTGFTPGILQFYILIGYNTSPQDDLMRIKYLKRKSIDAFAMPYNKNDPYQRNFARWVNLHLYKKVSWSEFSSHLKSTFEIEINKTNWIRIDK